MSRAQLLHSFLWHIMLIPRRPDPAKAYKELKDNAVAFGAIVATVRVLPYLFHFFQKKD
jgi:hypothetical protein